MFDHAITLELFLSKVEVQPDGGWHWTGTITKGGYGQFHGNNIQMLAHRAAYMLYVDSIPHGAELDHVCHTNDLSCPGGDGDPHRRCVFWEHLEPVTRLENVRRSRKAGQRRCKYGHEFTPENTYIDKRGRRECRRDRSAEWVRTHNPGVRHGTETECPQGHLYEGDNLYVIPSTGGRMCRQCKRDQSRESARRRRAAKALAKREVTELAFMEEIAVLLGPAPDGELVLF